MPDAIYAEIKGIDTATAQHLLKEPPSRATFAHLFFMFRVD
jgi:hypothetical protein